MDTKSRQEVKHIGMEDEKDNAFQIWICFISFRVMRRVYKK